MQAYDSIMCEYLCTGLIDFMFVRKTLPEYTNLISPNNFKKNDDIILNYLMSNSYNGWFSQNTKYVSKFECYSIKWTTI